MTLTTYAYLALLLLLQQGSFVLVSRSRQSASIPYHGVCSILSNIFYIWVLAEFVQHYTNMALKVWYVIWCVIGSLGGHWLSLHKLEKTKTLSKSRMVSYEEYDKLQQKHTTLSLQVELLTERLNSK